MDTDWRRVQRKSCGTAAPAVGFGVAFSGQELRAKGQGPFFYFQRSCAPQRSLKIADSLQRINSESGHWPNSHELKSVAIAVYERSCAACKQCCITLVGDGEKRWEISVRGGSITNNYQHLELNLVIGKVCIWS
jgi:hypothetical protein